MKNIVENKLKNTVDSNFKDVVDIYLTVSKSAAGELRELLGY